MSCVGTSGSGKTIDLIQTIFVGLNLVVSTATSA